jgi:peptidoglycan/LPS O-acetylase OafA/YrhL
MNPSPIPDQTTRKPVADRGLPNRSVRIPALDGLRGVAILLVLVRHSVVGFPTHSPILRGVLASGRLAWSGVDLFFVLSGFLIGGILLDARESPRYFKTFYIRRAYRILPIYGTVLLVFFIHHLPFHGVPGSLGDFSPVSIPWIAYLTLTQNFWMAHWGQYGPPAMAVTWSLAVEEQFYLTIPFAIRKLGRKPLFVLLMGLIVGAPLLRFAVRHLLSHGDFACYVLMPCRADALCLGVLSAFLARTEVGWRTLMQRRRALYGVTAFLLAGIAYITYKDYDQFPGFMSTLGYSWLALFFGGCLLIAVSDPDGVVQKILRARALRWLGSVSYCTYLVHFVLINEGRRWFAQHYSESTSYVLGGLAGVALSLLLAALSYAFYERPLLRRGHRHSY